MDNILGFRGNRIPDIQSTPGRGKVVWDTPDGKIVFEQHPYHPDAPDWHQGPHWHYDLEGQSHLRGLPGDDMPVEFEG
jgi:hypothetical protein